MIRIKHTLAAIPLAASLILGLTLAANAQTVNQPRLAVNLLTSGLTTNAGPGVQNATMASVRLDTTGSGDDVRLSSLPLILSTGNNALGTSLQSCHLVNSANSSVSLSNGSNIPGTLVGGTNVFTFDTPLVLPRNTVTTLNLMCNIDTAAVNGGTFTFSLNTANVVATGNTTGLPAVVTVGGAIPPVVVPPVITPGLPNTGFGGEATQNIALIAGSLAVALVALVYSRRYARS